MNKLSTSLSLVLFFSTLALAQIKEWKESETCGVRHYQSYTIEKPKPETSHESGPGYSSMTTTTTTTLIDPGTKALVVSPPVILGAIIGAKIPGKWKAIYSAEQGDNPVSWNLTVSPSRHGKPFIGFQFRF